MSDKPARKPSTLSASRAQAAARPLGSSLLVGNSGAARGPIHASNRPQSAIFGRPSPPRVTAGVGVATTAGSASTVTPSVRTESAGARVGATTRHAPLRHAPSRNARSTEGARPGGSSESRDRWLVIGVVSVFLVCAVGLMSINLVNSSREATAREEVTTAFAQVHQRQSEFRALFGRFATWPELAARGVTIGEHQKVREWNASKSHWFISIRDLNTGMICDRTGELFDEEAAERDPVCRPIN